MLRAPGPTTNSKVRSTETPRRMTCGAPVYQVRGELLMRSRVMLLRCGYIAASMLVATSMAAALAATLPANAKGVTAREPCFSEVAQPDKRIAACTALIRSGVAGSAALLSRAGAFGQKGDYEHAVEDATQVIALAPSPAAYYTRALAYHDGGDDMQAIADC